jgi:hypothetical protein
MEPYRMLRADLAESAVKIPLLSEPFTRDGHGNQTFKGHRHVVRIEL